MSATEAGEVGGERPTHLDLFSGIGGFALAARWAGFETIGFCEIDKYCQRVISKNFGATLADAADARCNGEAREHECGRALLSARSSECGSRTELFRDIRELDGARFQGTDLITGGFPCQPFSCAGKRRGAADDRHLWPEMLRVIKEARPAWVLGENVAGIIGMELDTVLSDLESQGYACRPFVIPACGVDARHRRNRVWIVAHNASTGLQLNREMQKGRELAGRHAPNGSSGILADTGRNDGRQNFARRETEERTASRRNGEAVPDSERGGLRDKGNRVGCEAASTRWQPEPDVGRVANGIPARVDRLRGLGNAIVPQVAFQILKEIRKLI